jgi:hypothetical protein
LRPALRALDTRPALFTRVPPVAAMRPAGNTVDPTDLVALVMLGVAVWDARRLMQRSRPG